MISTSYLDSQVTKRERINRVNMKPSRRSSSDSMSNFSNGISNRSNMSKISLLHRYMKLLKTTVIAFFLSTCIHIGCVTGYYGLYLWMYPDDEGKKNFYSQTSVSQGVNIGGRMLGGGGIQTNHHKSYLFHLVREYYKTLSKLFFAIYLLLLVLLKFFPEHAKLKEDTAAVFNLRSMYENNPPNQVINKKSSEHTTTKRRPLKHLKTLRLNKNTARKFNKYSMNHTAEEIINEQVDAEDEIENDEYDQNETEFQNLQQIDNEQEENIDKKNL